MLTDQEVTRRIKLCAHLLVGNWAAEYRLPLLLPITLLNALEVQVADTMTALFDEIIAEGVSTNDDNNNNN